MNWLDLTGASLSLISTYYFTQGRHTAWVVGLLAIALNTVLYWQKGIYGHVMLESVYFFIMIIGLVKWKKEKSVSVTQLTPPQMFYAALGVLASFLLYAWILMTFTPSKLPYWDACTTVLCLFAQALMIYKIILCWMVWFVVDAMIVYLQWQQGMPFHSIVTFLYLGLAILGYFRWKQEFVQPTEEVPFSSLFSK